MNDKERIAELEEQLVDILERLEQMPPSFERQWELHQKWMAGQEGGVRLSLNGLNFRGIDLRSADLREADLRWADLTGADLSEATLNGVRLYKDEWAALKPIEKVSKAWAPRSVGTLGPANPQE